MNAWQSILFRTYFLQEARAQLAQAAVAAALAAAQAMNEAVQATESAEAEAAAAAQRDPRRNGMDNPFGDGRPEPMHPSLARLTGMPLHFNHFPAHEATGNYCPRWSFTICALCMFLGICSIPCR